ncbi:hypothetical protein N9K11_01605 [bacterium]|nr:hypothetical protein [bacterium]
MSLSPTSPVPVPPPLPVHEFTPPSSPNLGPVPIPESTESTTLSLLELPGILALPKSEKKVKPIQGIQFLGSATMTASGQLSYSFRKSVSTALHRLTVDEARYVKNVLSKRFGTQLKKRMTYTPEAKEKMIGHLMQNLERFKNKYAPPSSPTKKKRKRQRAKEAMRMPDEDGPLNLMERSTFSDFLPKQ